MAHNIQAYPQPREQLRTEAPRQRPHNDKYVTVFQSGIAHVDLTFRDPLLTESADHFAVGIDELTISLGSLSMLEYNATTPIVLLRVSLRGHDGATDAHDWRFPDAAWRDAFAFKADRPYTNLQEILSRMNTIASVVTNYIVDYGLQNPGGAPIYDYAVPVGTDIEHLKITLTENETLVSKGRGRFGPTLL